MVVFHLFMIFNGGKKCITHVNPLAANEMGCLSQCREHQQGFLHIQKKTGSGSVK